MTALRPSEAESRAPVGLDRPGDASAAASAPSSWPGTRIMITGGTPSQGMARLHHNLNDPSQYPDEDIALDSGRLGPRRSNASLSFCTDRRRTGNVFIRVLVTVPGWTRMFIRVIMAGIR